MKVQELLFAHGAFYQFERRAKFYDEYLRNRNNTQWLSPDLPMNEIDKLFKFIKRWDYHFRGSKNKFKFVYQNIYPLFVDLRDELFINIDLSSKDNEFKITTIFDAFAICNEEGRYESTDASKIIHTINPRLFIMWDRRIR